MQDDECSILLRIRRLSGLSVCEINIADASAEGSEKGDLLLPINVVAHGKTVNLGRAGDLHIPRSRGQCQEAMGTAAMTGFGDRIVPSEWSGFGHDCRDVNQHAVGMQILDESRQN
jgi:hypothetical protein